MGEAVGVGEAVVLVGEGDGDAVVRVGEGEGDAVEVGELVGVGVGEAVVLDGEGDGEAVGDAVGVGDVVTAGADPVPGHVCESRIPELEFKISAYEPA